MPVCVSFQKVGTLLLYYNMFTVFENRQKSRIQLIGSKVSYIYILSGQMIDFGT